jgi:hypothetical protein
MNFMIVWKIFWFIFLAWKICFIMSLNRFNIVWWIKWFVIWIKINHFIWFTKKYLFITSMICRNESLLMNWNNLNKFNKFNKFNEFNKFNKFNKFDILDGNINLNFFVLKMFENQNLCLTLDLLSWFSYNHFDAFSVIDFSFHDWTF